MTPTGLPDDLNPGIRRAVEALVSLGFRTIDSGDGATHDHECDREWPYIVIRVGQERLVRDVQRVAAILEDCGILLGEAPPCGAEGLVEDPGEMRAGTWLTASFCPNNRTPWGIIEIDFLPGDEEKLGEPRGHPVGG